MGVCCRRTQYLKQSARFVIWLNKKTTVVPMSQCSVTKQMVNAIACTIELWMQLGGLLSTQKARVALGYRLVYWQTRTHCCGHIVAHDVSCTAQTGKHLLRTQNVSEQNQKHFMCPVHKVCVRNKCCARGQTEKHFCRQQCVLFYQGL